jgi:hypothetical protein
MSSRLKRNLRWLSPAATEGVEAPASSPAARGVAAGNVPGGAVAAGALAAGTVATADPGTAKIITVPSPGRPWHEPALAPREETIYLLHIAAEVEHALMVQYLYAAFSLEGSQDTPEHAAIAADWRSTLFDIAREEMGHLVTVENLLQLIGGPVTFEREDFPIVAGLYPFEFTLEPLTKHSLAKYVVAEMPDEDEIEDPQLKQEIEEIKNVALLSNEEQTVNRVGAIYDELMRLFGSLPSADIQPESRRYQARPDEWSLGQKNVLIRQASTRREALLALQAVAEQGEGATMESISDVPERSHFERFLEIYRAFPDDSSTWKPARRVPFNPTIEATQPPDNLDKATEEETSDENIITHPVSRGWAMLFNQRYRMLLMYLSHVFHAAGVVPDTVSVEGAAPRSPRALLISWAFGEMYNVRTLGRILTTQPRHAGGSPDEVAGAPFEMPYSLVLPPREPDRWRIHRDNITASNTLIDTLLSTPSVAAVEEHEKYLVGLKRTGQNALNQILPIIAGAQQ